MRSIDSITDQNSLGQYQEMIELQPEQMSFFNHNSIS